MKLIFAYPLQRVVWTLGFQFASRGLFSARIIRAVCSPARYALRARVSVPAARRAPALVPARIAPWPIAIGPMAFPYSRAVSFARCAQRGFLPP